MFSILLKETSRFKSKHCINHNMNVYEYLHKILNNPTTTKKTRRPDPIRITNCSSIKKDLKRNELNQIQLLIKSP